MSMTRYRYKKLELARCAVTAGLGSKNKLSVIMLSQYGERFVDVPMAEAVVAGEKHIYAYTYPEAHV